MSEESKNPIIDAVTKSAIDRASIAIVWTKVAEMAAHAAEYSLNKMEAGDKKAYTSEEVKIIKDLVITCKQIPLLIMMLSTEFRKTLGEDIGES